MESLKRAIIDTIPISQFNRGLAGKIFEDVKRTGAKIVMKNNSAECVLLSPEEYVRIVDALDEERLLNIAVSRTFKATPDSLISEEEIASRLGITDEELDEIEVEFE